MRKLTIILSAIAFLAIGCGETTDPIALESVTLEGDITAELDVSGIEELLANIILTQQKSNLFVYNVDANISSGRIRDEDGQPLFDQYRMTITFNGTITAGNQNIIINDVYVDFNPVQLGAFFDELPGANKLNIIPSKIRAGSTAEFFVGKRYEANGAMLNGFTYELHVDAKADGE